MSSREILPLIEDLKKYDNEEGYKLSYAEVKARLSDTVRKLAEKGEGALDHLHPLLIREETWSSLFALRIIKDIKSERSVPYLINFIKKNEEGDYWEACEDAMVDLSSIGEPAVVPLLEEVKSDFEDSTYYTFLVGSLTKIRDARVYSFMKEIVEDYIGNHERYEEWFDITDFVFDFEVQGEKGILPLLREIISVGDLSEHGRIEIQDTIDIIEDPEGFRQRIRKIAEKPKPPSGKPFSRGKKIGRNDPCPCGSGKKYKKCCLKKEMGQKAEEFGERRAAEEAEGGSIGERG